MRDAVSFLIYFLRLRLSIALGQYYTANPVSFKWRWRHWQQIKAIEHARDVNFSAG
jgi:hypothetical protein